MFKLILLVNFLILSLIYAESNSGEVKIREDFAATPPELPITQKHVVNKNLTLKLHGDKEKIKKSHHANKKNDPHYVWSGRTQSLWALSLELKEALPVKSKSLNLKWRTKQSGGRVLYFIVQNEAGEWFIYNEGTATAKDWNESSFTFEPTKWSKLDIKSLKKGEKVTSLELKGIKSIGFTDLQRGGASKASSRVDWLELTLK